jgi:hypothetical protein
MTIREGTRLKLDRATTTRTRRRRRAERRMRVCPSPSWGAQPAAPRDDDARGARGAAEFVGYDDWPRR